MNGKQSILQLSHYISRPRNNLADAKEEIGLYIMISSSASGDITASYSSIYYTKLRDIEQHKLQCRCTSNSALPVKRELRY